MIYQLQKLVTNLCVGKEAYSSILDVGKEAYYTIPGAGKQAYSTIPWAGNGYSWANGHWAFMLPFRMGEKCHWVRGQSDHIG